MENISKILIVDDDEDILELLSFNLKNNGFVVESASNGSLAIQKAREFSPDLILLDIMRPEMDGVEACGEIRKIDKLKSTIIIFLTARGEDYSQLAGYRAGADDYITKPIKPKLLIAKLNAILNMKRRENPILPLKSNELRYDANLIYLSTNVAINEDAYSVLKNNIDVKLTRKEFELLNYLRKKPFKVISREHILSKIWGSDIIVGERTIDVHISKIRDKTGLDNIKTIKGIGYRYES